MGDSSVWDARQPNDWEQGFSYLKQFSDREGHCRVPEEYKADDDYPLGAWVLSQKDSPKAPDRLRRLNGLPGWSVGTISDKWQRGFSYLKQFSDREGHAQVPINHKTDDGFQLGHWVGTQRMVFRSKKMDLHRQQRLEALPGWSWAPESDKFNAFWEKGFAKLKQFLEQEGHAQVPINHKTDDGFQLGRWVGTQRMLFRSKKMDLHRQQRLEALPGWSWAPESDKFNAFWEKGFGHLKQFSDLRGHSRVPLHYKTGDGFQLGRWVGFQSVQFRRGKMDPDRRLRLEALPGWVWRITK